jgi:hypothetical protein
MADKPPLFWIILFAIAVVVIAGVAFYVGSSTTGQDLPPGVENVTRIEVTGILESKYKTSEVILEAAFPAVPEKMTVFTVDRNVSEKELLQIADNLGVSDVMSKNPLGFIYVGEGDYKIGLYKGTVDYSNKTPLPGYSPEYIDSHLPSDEEARRIADEFLDLHNLRPDGAVFYDITHDIGHFVDPPKGVKIKNSESINVWYKHWIDDSMIQTDKLYIEVDVHGQVRKMFREWPHYEPYKELSIIGPEVAYGYLKASPIVIPDGMMTPEKARVTNVSVVYIDHTMTEDLDYLIPVYYFQGVVQGDGKEAAFYQCIPATPEFAAEIA